MTGCLVCHASMDGGSYVLLQEPAGYSWRVCSLPCLAVLVRGGQDERELAGGYVGKHETGTGWPA